MLNCQMPFKSAKIRSFGSEKCQLGNTVGGVGCHKKLWRQMMQGLLQGGCPAATLSTVSKHRLKPEKIIPWI